LQALPIDTVCTNPVLQRSNNHKERSGVKAFSIENRLIRMDLLLQKENGHETTH
jgi:hypothetical protein